MSDTKLEPIKNCPFCGGDSLGHGFNWPPMQGNVQCYDCNAYIVADTEAEAIAAWNRRSELSRRLAPAGRDVVPIGSLERWADNLERAYGIEAALPQAVREFVFRFRHNPQSPSQERK